MLKEDNKDKDHSGNKDEKDKEDKDNKDNNTIDNKQTKSTHYDYTKMMNTIYLPRKLKEINSVLPKSKYKDINIR